MERLTKIVGYAVTIAWLVSFVVDVVSPTYDPPAAIHAAMMMVVGALFGHRVLAKTKEADV